MLEPKRIICGIVATIVATFSFMVLCGCSLFPNGGAAGAEKYYHDKYGANAKVVKEIPTYTQSGFTKSKSSITYYQMSDSSYVVYNDITNSYLDNAQASELVPLLTKEMLMPAVNDLVRELEGDTSKTTISTTSCAPSGGTEYPTVYFGYEHDFPSDSPVNAFFAERYDGDLEDFVVREEIDVHAYIEIFVPVSDIDAYRINKSYPSDSQLQALKQFARKSWEWQSVNGEFCPSNDHTHFNDINIYVNVIDPDGNDEQLFSAKIEEDYLLYSDVRKRGDGSIASSSVDKHEWNITRQEYEKIVRHGN